MSDSWCVVLALATLAGAWGARSVPVVVVVGVVCAALATRRIGPLRLCVAAAIVASFGAARSWEGVRQAPTRGDVASGAVLVRDPEWAYGAVRVELRLDLDDRRVLATARGDPATVLSRRLAGERVRVEGRRRALSGRAVPSLHRRHIGSALTVTQAVGTTAGGPVARFTNELRRTLVRGASSMPPERRALFTGLVLGDDREQSPSEVDDFRASGLSHLLAVSGQNVVFALAVAAPLLRRLTLRARFGVGVGVLLVFGALTRWEPSVLRAVAMAGIALLATTVGRPASSMRVLALAATGLVLVDPMLAGSIGFLLSAGACAGIALLGPVFERRRFPAAVAISAAAQIGVAPVLLTTFGAIPLASLPANVLAVPAAGPVMVWGLVAGVPAGLVGGRAAWLLHLPTRVLLAWIAGVAHAAARWPLPAVGAVGFSITLVAGAALLGTRGRMRAAVASVVVATLLVVGGRSPPDGGGVPLTEGARLWRTDGATVLAVAGNADEGALLAALRGAQVRRVDVLVLRSGGSASARLAAAVRHRSTVGLVLAPKGHRVPGAVAVSGERLVTVGPLSADLRGTSERLDLSVRRDEGRVGGAE
jgi:competence protein ComEC